MTPHPFAPDADGDCSCGLPRANRCHTAAAPPPLASTPVEQIKPVTGHAHPGTSHIAATSLPGYGTILRSVIDSIWASGDHGRTDDEMEVETGMSHQTISAARNRLVAHGWLMPRHDDGAKVTRPTRSGRPATVWRLTEGTRRAYTNNRPTE